MIKKETLLKLKEQQELLDSKQNELKVKKEQFENETNDLKESIASLNDEIEQQKGLISVDALLEYKETNKKKLLGGIGIRETKQLLYDADNALNWAKESKMCLQLDKKSFEKIASVQSLDFVSNKIVPKITFPKQIKLED